MPAIVTLLFDNLTYKGVQRSRSQLDSEVPRVPRLPVIRMIMLISLYCYPDEVNTLFLKRIFDYFHSIFVGTVIFRTGSRGF